METTGDLFIRKVNQVQDYIENHLDEPLTVTALAELIHFSEFYFHRMFTLVTGESLYGFIKRIRLEKAAFRILSNRNANITDIALSVGFSNSSSFAKAFRNHFGLSASRFRSSKNGQVRTTDPLYNKGIDFEAYCRETEVFSPLHVGLKTLPARDLVYTRYKGPYKGDAHLFRDLFTRLYEWVRDKGLLEEGGDWLTLYHDQGSMTEEDFLRVSVCMEVNGPVEADGIFGRYELEGGLYAVGRFEVTTEEYSRAWDYMFIHWLPRSGYFHDDRLPMETYPSVAPSVKGKRVVDICIPVAPLNQ